MDHSKDQKRVLKNTVMLYVRMAVIMGVSIFTSRIILQSLGVEDFGVFNIVGGIVVSLTFITNTLISSTQRFLSYEIGVGNSKEVSNVFSMSINIHLLFVILVIFFLETIGLWFLNNVIVVPPTRIYAANIVFHTSVLIFSLNLIRVPFNALIISTEKMNVYAVISIIEAIVKLVIAYMITLFPDRLIAYGIMLLLANILINLAYIISCKLLCSQYCTYKFEKNAPLLKRMLGFSGWNMLGGVSGVAVQEGPNYLMNIFLGVHINAAMGLAKQVSGAIYSFTSNFQTAFNPQIVKLYASKDFEYLKKMIFMSSQLSFYFMMVFAVPIIIYSKLIFSIWLVEVPDYAIDFCIILMSSQMISAIGSPLWMVVHATGNIKKYQLTLSIFNLLVLPVIWLCLKLEFPPTTVLISLLVFNVLVLVYRIVYLKNHADFPAGDFIKHVLIKCLLLLVFSFLSSKIISLLPFCGMYRLILFFLSFVVTVLIIYFFGLSKSIRAKVLNYLVYKVSK